MSTTPRPRPRPQLDPGPYAQVQLQIMSDLHLESPTIEPIYEHFRIEPTAPYLLLLGDIGHADDGYLYEFLSRQLRQFSGVFFIFGSREMYGATYDQAREYMRSFERHHNALVENTAGHARQPGVFNFLDRTRVDLTSHLTLLGCTLFTNVHDSQARSVEALIDEFCFINDWDVDAHNRAHARDLDWLNEQVMSIERNEPHRLVMVATHYPPTMDQLIHSIELSYDIYGVRTATANCLEGQPCWESRNVRLWAFGHSHINTDTIDFRTGKRVLTNQRGKSFEPARVNAFDKGKVITLSARPG